MTKEEIEELKQKIKDGWQIANDPICREGFKSANQLIAQYELDIKTLYLQLQLIKNYLPSYLKSMCDYSDFNT